MPPSYLPTSTGYQHLIHHALEVAAALAYTQCAPGPGITP